MNAPHPDRILLEPPAPADDVSITDVLSIARQYWKTLVVVPLASGVVALGLSYLIEPTFVAASKLLPPQQSGGTAMAMLSQQLGSLAGLAGAAAGIKNPADQYVAMLRSRTIADRLIERFKLRELYAADFIEDARRELAGNSSITAGSKDGIITIEVEDTDPARAAAIANAYVEELETVMKSLALSEAAQRRVFFEKELKATRDNLARAEMALRQGGVSAGVLRSEPRATVEEMARLKASLTLAEIKVASQRGFLADSHPDIRQAQQEIAVLRAKLRDAEQAGDPKGEGQGEQYFARFRDFKYAEALFELMARQYEAARIDEARDPILIQVIDVALPAEKKAKPRKALIAVITTVGVFLFTVFAVALHRSLKTR